MDLRAYKKNFCSILFFIVAQILFVKDAKIALDFEPPPPEQISARKRARNSEFSCNPAKKSLVGALRRPLEFVFGTVKFYYGVSLRLR